MDLIEKKVKHIKLRKGFITQQEDFYVSVKFVAETATKRCYAYTFETDDELTYPEGTQISSCQDNTSSEGQLLGVKIF